jgi:hypothetical protein
VRKYVNTYRRTFVSSTGNALLIFWAWSLSLELSVWITG